MTVEQILTEIYRSSCADEVFLALSKHIISEKEELNKQIVENNATLRPAVTDRYFEGYAKGYIDGSTGVDRGDKEE